MTPQYFYLHSNIHNILIFLFCMEVLTVVTADSSADKGIGIGIGTEMSPKIKQMNNSKYESYLCLYNSFTLTG